MQRASCAVGLTGCRPQRTRPVPVEWLVSRTAVAVTRFFVGLALLLAGMGAGLQAFQAGSTAPLIGAPVVLVLAIASKFLARPFPRAYEAITLLNFLVLQMIILVEASAFPDAQTRHRLLGLGMPFIKPFPIVFGTSELSYLIFLTVCSVAEAIGNYLVTAMHGEKLEPYIYINIFGISLVFALLEKMMHFWLREIYETEYETERELVRVLAHQTLVSSMCDCSFWLASDADTITQCDRRFESIIGAPARGTRLSAHIPQTEEEQGRLRAAFERIPAEADSPPVAPLITSLRSATCNVVTPVDLTIVDHRAVMGKGLGEAAERGSFLVGARVQEPELPQAVAVDPARVPAPAPPAGAAQAAAVPPPEADAASDVVAHRVRLPELEEVSVEFEVESESMAIRRLALCFVPPAPGVQLPRFIDSLQERVPGRFRNWVHGRLNKAFAPEAADDSDASDGPPNYGRIMFEMPAMSNGVMLAGESAHLEVPEEVDLHPDPNAGPLSATLRVRGLWQVQFQRQLRVPQPAAAEGPRPAPALAMQL